MSLDDRTNETIPLSQHAPMHDGEKLCPAELTVDVDHDSSFIPSVWVDISLTDAEHDSDRIKLSFDEARLLHDRLGLILGRPQGEPTAQDLIDYIFDPEEDDENGSIRYGLIFEMLADLRLRTAGGVR